MKEWITFTAGILVMVLAWKLIYGNSKQGFVERATRKGWVTRGKLIRTYTSEGKNYGTYEYKAEGSTYSIEVEHDMDSCEEEPPVYRGIYYRNSNPEIAYVKEKSPIKNRRENRKRGVVFSIVLMTVVGIMKIVFESSLF